MSLVKQNINTEAVYLENKFWNKEALLDGMVVFHTIQCQKISKQVSKNLTDSNFILEDIKRKQEIVFSKKLMPASTEIQEVHINNLKVTEGSIVSIVKPNGRTTQISIDEGEPSAKYFPVAKDNTFESRSEEITTDFKRVEHEHFVFRNEVARDRNSFFFRAKNSENLYGLGDNYYKDFKAGYKHFSFTHLGAAEAQKQTIVGVASLIYYFENVKILIITSKMENTFYKTFKNDECKTQAEISVYPEFKFDLYTHEGISYLEVEEIADKSRAHKLKGIEFLFRQITQDFDVVLYDLPAVSVCKEKYDTYFPLLQLIQNVTFIVSLQRDKFVDLNGLKSYFMNYKIKLKGCVVEKVNGKGETDDR